MEELFILDDFFRDPDWIDEFLKEFSGFQQPNVNYPHLVFPTPIARVKEAILRLGERIDPIFHTTPFEASLRVSVSEHADKHQSFVHRDESLNVIIYLSGTEGPEGGTHFYRHRELGIEAFGEDEKMTAKMALLMKYDTNDLSQWILKERVPFKRNRAVVFSGRLFHSPPPLYYGDTISAGRVTLNFFFPELRNFLKGR